MYGGANITLNIKTLAGDTIAITMDDSSTVLDLKREYIAKNPEMGSVAALKLTVLHEDLPAVPSGLNVKGFTELDDKKTLASYHFHSEQDLSAFTDGTITFTIPAGYNMKYPPSHRDGGKWLKAQPVIYRLLLDIESYLLYININSTSTVEPNISQFTAEGSIDGGDGGYVNVVIDAQFTGNDKSTIKISITDLMQHTNANNNPQLDSDAFSTMVEKIRKFVSPNGGGKRKSRRTRRARTRRSRTRTRR